MANYQGFTFDPTALNDFLRGDFMKMFPQAKMPSFDASEVFEAQKKNVEALVATNQAAAEAYQDLFNKQAEIFETTLAEAKKNIEGLDASKSGADVAQAQMEYAKTAFEKALKNMTALAEEAQKANSKAYDVVSSRIEDSVKELQALSKKFSA